LITLIGCDTTGDGKELRWGINPFSTDEGSALDNKHTDAFPADYLITTASDMNFSSDVFSLDGLNCYDEPNPPTDPPRVYNPISDNLFYRFSIILEETATDIDDPKPQSSFDQFLFPEGMKLQFKTDGTWKYSGLIPNLFNWVPELKLPVGAKFDSATQAGGNYFTYFNAGHNVYLFTWKLVVDIYKTEEDFLTATPGILEGDLDDFIDAKVFTSRQLYSDYKSENPIDELDVLEYEESENQQSLYIIKSPNTFRDFFLQTYPEERREVELAFGISKIEEYDTQIVNGKEVSKYFIVDGVRKTGSEYLQYLLDNGFVRRFT